MHRATRFLALAFLTTLTGFTAALAGDGPRVAAQDALDRLSAGNARFVAESGRPADLSGERREELAAGQHPFAVIVTCADSRVAPEHVFNAGLGELFVIRQAGNVADTETIASVEYAAAHLGTRLIVVVGHDKCGAVAAAAAGAKDTPAIQTLVAQIAPAVEAARASGLADAQATDEAISLNARLAAGHLLERSDALRGFAEREGLKVIAARYHLASGQVEWLETAGLQLHAAAPTPAGEVAAASEGH